MAVWESSITTPLHDIQSQACYTTTQHCSLTMASARPFTTLVRVRPSSQVVAALNAARHASPSAIAMFSTSSSRTATPSGPPPAGFRLPRAERWDESKESSLDKAGNYFLLTELFRGMYIVLEQYFRPPYGTLRGKACSHC